MNGPQCPTGVERGREGAKDFLRIDVVVADCLLAACIVHTAALVSALSTALRVARTRHGVRDADFVEGEVLGQVVVEARLWLAGSHAEFILVSFDDVVVAQRMESHFSDLNLLRCFDALARNSKRVLIAGR